MSQTVIDKKLKSQYDNQYQDSVTEWRKLGAELKAQNIIEITQGYTFQKVLEVGAGEGSILKILDDKRFAEELYALEISESGLEQIRKKEISSLKKANIFDGYKIPYDDNSFELVILSHVLEHVEFERTLLREIKRVARYQVIEVPRDYRRGIEKKATHFLSYGHINMYTPSSIQFLLKTEDFQILKVKLGIYNKKIFEFLAGADLKKKIINRMAYYFKKIVLLTAPATYKEKYSTTITLFTKSR